MKLFLSWSGEHSHAVAQSFNDWLPTGIQSVKPWISSEHISKGATWLEEIRKALSESNGIGLSFLTRQALRSEWLLFEAGGIAALDKKRVCTVCIDLPPSDLSPPPNFFQATKLEKPDVLKLDKDLNSQTPEPLTDAVLTRTFERAWPELDRSLQDALANSQTSASKQSAAKPPSATAAHFEQMMEALRRVELRIGRIEERQSMLMAVPGLEPQGGNLALPGIGARLIAADFARQFEVDRKGANALTLERGLADARPNALMAPQAAKAARAAKPHRYGLADAKPQQNALRKTSKPPSR